MQNKDEQEGPNEDEQRAMEMPQKAGQEHVKAKRKKRIQTSKPAMTRHRQKALKSAEMRSRPRDTKTALPAGNGEEWGDIPDELLIPEDDEYLSQEENINSNGESGSTSSQNNHRAEAKKKRREVERIMERVFDFGFKGKHSVNLSRLRLHGKRGDFDLRKLRNQTSNCVSRRDTFVNARNAAIKKSSESKLQTLKNKISSQKAYEIENLEKFQTNYLGDFDLDLIEADLWKKLLEWEQAGELTEKKSFRKLTISQKLKEKVERECPVLMEFVRVHLESSGELHRNYGEKVLKTRDIRKKLTEQRVTDEIREDLRDAQSCLSGQVDPEATQITIISEPPSKFINSFKTCEQSHETLSALHLQRVGSGQRHRHSSNQQNLSVHPSYKKSGYSFKSSKFKQGNMSEMAHTWKSHNKENAPGAVHKKKRRVDSPGSFAGNDKSASNLNLVSKRFLSTLPERSMNAELIPLHRNSQRRFKRQIKSALSTKFKHPISISNVQIFVSPRKKNLPSIHCAKYQGGCFGERALAKMGRPQVPLEEEDAPVYSYQPFFKKHPQPFKHFQPPKPEPTKTRPQTSIVKNKHRKKAKLRRPQTSVTKNIESKRAKRGHVKGCYHRVLTSKTSPLLFPSTLNNPDTVLSSLFPLEKPLFSSIRDLKVQSRAQGNSVTSISRWRNLLSFAQEYMRLGRFARAEKYFQKLFRHTQHVRDPNSMNFLTNQLSFCLYKQQKLVESFVFNCTNFRRLRAKDQLICLYNAALISRQMGNLRMEFYFLELTSRVANLLSERDFTLLASLQIVVFFILCTCFRTAERLLDVNGAPGLTC